MKNYIIIAFAIFFSWLSYEAYALKSELPTDGKKTKIEGHSADCRKDVSLTIASQTVDMNDDISWAVYVPADCKFRNMSTATKAGMQKTLPSGVWFGQVVRTGSAFTNFSGCTSGELERQ
jgi:hypothetical protein